MDSSANRFPCPTCGRELAGPGVPCPNCTAPGSTIAGPAEQLPQSFFNAGPPRVTIFFIAINVLVFVAMVVKGVPLLKPSPAQLIRWGANYGPLTLSGQWWRLLTSMFLHIGLVHLGINMWCFFEMGLLAERLYRRSTYIGVYLLAGLAGSLASLARNPTIVSAGASGAIFGVAGALITTLYFGRLPVPRSALKEMLRSLVLFAGYNLAYGLFNTSVDNGAHIGGLGCGLLLGALLSHDALPHARPAWYRPLVLPVFALALLASGLGLRHADYSLVYLHQAGNALARHDPDAALSELQALLRKKPDFAPAYSMMGDIYLLRQQLPQAQAAYEKVMQLEPNNAAVQTQLGALYLRSSQPEKARDALVKAVQMNPRNTLAYLNLGVALQQMGKYDEARDAYQKAVSLQPDLAAGQFSLGELAMRNRRYDEAIGAFRQAAKLRPNDPGMLIWLGNAYQAKGMEKEAQAAFAQAYALKQKQPPRRPSQ